MLKEKLKNSIIILALGFGLGTIIYNIYSDKLDYQNTKILNNKLDSLNSISSDIDILKRTITIAYSGISEEEARYYAYIFYTTSKRYKVVDPCAYAALIRIESGWNSTLVSNRKCRGLTQVSTLVAKDECEKFKIDYKEGVTEWNVIPNLIIGLNYFSQRYDVKGMDYAMRAYIGGDNWNATTGVNREYIDKYVKDFSTEYQKVNYIHKGVIYETSLNRR